MSVQRRDSSRSRLLQRAKIVLNSGFTSIDCIVLDLSEGGARIRVAGCMGLPQQFELRMPNQPSRIAEIRYRNGDDAGVRFIDARPNP